MKITWNSRKGMARKVNSDAAALAYVGDYLIAVVVDAAEKTCGNRLLFGVSSEGKRLAAWWADNCAQTLANAPELLVSEHEIVRQLAVLQKKLRPYFLHDIASYGVLVLHRRSGAADWYYTGDCRLGIESASGGLEWLGTPHRVDAFLGVNIDASQGKRDELKQAARHTLTRTLNVKRFSTPEAIKARFDQDATESIRLLVATDGHWCEDPERHIGSAVVSDDASLLTITYGQKMLTLHTDAPNLFITYRE
jgi:hypothetical protein